MNKEKYLNIKSIKKFPIFMGAVNKSFQVEKKDMNFQIDQNSGKIRIYPRVPLGKLYKYKHGEGTTGMTWQLHHHTFFKFCEKYLRGNILEIGAGSNSITKYISDFSKINKFISIGKNIKLKKQNKKIIYIDKFVKLEKINYKFDLIIHSHFFEHLFNPIKFLKLIKLKLNKNGLHIFSMPNMKPMIKKGLANAVSFEHPFYYDQDLVKSYLENNYFKIKKKKIFGKSHSVMYQTKVIKKKKKFSYSKFSENYKLFKNLFIKWEKDVQKINNFLQKKEKVYLFGAHIFSQLIIYLNLNKGINGVIDNDKLKQNKYLCGTNYKIFSPIKLINQGKVYVYLRAGQYDKEIKNQIKKINNKVIFI